MKRVDVTSQLADLAGNVDWAKVSVDEAVRFANAVERYRDAREVLDVKRALWTTARRLLLTACIITIATLITQAPAPIVVLAFFTVIALRAGHAFLLARREESMVTYHEQIAQDITHDLTNDHPLE